MVFSFENLDPEFQPQAVFEPVGFILGRIEFELHAAYYVNHT